MQDLLDRLEAAGPSLTPTERRIAETLLDDPGEVAFGTVAELASRASASGASVVRFANRLGFDGYTALQAAVQRAVGRQLRPATERIREAGRAATTAAVEIEVANVRSTLGAVDAKAFNRAVELLADPRRRVAVLAGDAEHGIGTMLTTSLAMLRPTVSQLAGNDTAVGRQIAALERGDVLVAIDLRRYERWVVVAASHAAERGARVIALTDTVLSPLAGLATVAFTVRGEGAGPFDSHVGTLALANMLVAGVAAADRRAATARLDRVEGAWRALDALVESQ